MIELLMKPKRAERRPWEMENEFLRIQGKNNFSKIIFLNKTSLIQKNNYNDLIGREVFAE